MTGSCLAMEGLPAPASPLSHGHACTHAQAASKMQVQLAPKRVHMNREPRRKREFAERSGVARR